MQAILKIDIDFEAPPEWIDKLLKTRLVILDFLGFYVEKVIPHKSTRGINYFIHIARRNSTLMISDMEILMLQFLLGDDQTRCKINKWRIERGIKRWNKLFSRKIYRKTSRYIECYYCGNKILIPKAFKKVPM